MQSAGVGGRTRRVGSAGVLSRSRLEMATDSQVQPVLHVQGQPVLGRKGKSEVRAAREAGDTKKKSPVRPKGGSARREDASPTRPVAVPALELRSEVDTTPLREAEVSSTASTVSPAGRKEPEVAATVRESRLHPKGWLRHVQPDVVPDPKHCFVQESETTRSADVSPSLLSTVPRGPEMSKPAKIMQTQARQTSPAQKASARAVVRTMADVGRLGFNDASEPALDAVVSNAEVPAAIAFDSTKVVPGQVQGRVPRNSLRERPAVAGVAALPKSTPGSRPTRASALTGPPVSAQVAPTISSSDNGRCEPSVNQEFAANDQIDAAVGDSLPEVALEPACAAAPKRTPRERPTAPVKSGGGGVARKGAATRIIPGRSTGASRESSGSPPPSRQPSRLRQKPTHVDAPITDEFTASTVEGQIDHISTSEAVSTFEDPTLPVAEAMIDASVHRNGTADSVGIGQETIEDVRFRDMLSKSQSVPPDVFANPNSSISPCPQEPLASTDAEVAEIGRTEVGRSKSSLMRQKSPKRGASASPPRASRRQPSIRRWSTAGLPQDEEVVGRARSPRLSRPPGVASATEMPANAQAESVISDAASSEPSVAVLVAQSFLAQQASPQASQPSTAVLVAQKLEAPSAAELEAQAMVADFAQQLQDRDNEIARLRTALDDRTSECERLRARHEKAQQILGSGCHTPSGCASGRASPGDSLALPPGSAVVQGAHVAPFAQRLEAYVARVPAGLAPPVVAIAWGGSSSPPQSLEREVVESSVDMVSPVDLQPQSGETMGMQAENVFGGDASTGFRSDGGEAVDIAAQNAEFDLESRVTELDMTLQPADDADAPEEFGGRLATAGDSSASLFEPSADVVVPAAFRTVQCARLQRSPLQPMEGRPLPTAYGGPSKQASGIGSSAFTIEPLYCHSQSGSSLATEVQYASPHVAPRSVPPAPVSFLRLSATPRPMASQDSSRTIRRSTPRELSPHRVRTLTAGEPVSGPVLIVAPTINDALTTSAPLLRAGPPSGGAF